MQVFKFELAFDSEWDRFASKSSINAKRGKFYGCKMSKGIIISK